MCGRAYETYTEEELRFRYLNKRPVKIPSLRPNYNLAPTQYSPIVLIKDGEVQIELFRWGLIPFWAKDIQSVSKYSLINAKAEEITEKRSYKIPFQKRRCIVPLSGFFEWKKEQDETKHPFAIHMKDNSIMSIAGVWEQWTPQKSDPGEETIHSFSIITTEANQQMKSIHTRMPVILNPKDENEWLDPENQNEASLQKLLKPCPSSWLDAYEVSTRVNAPKNNDKSVLSPLKSEK